MNTKTKQLQVDAVIRSKKDRTKIIVIENRNRDTGKNPQPTFRKGAGAGRFTGRHLTGPEIGKISKNHIDIYDVEVLAPSTQDFIHGKGFAVPLSWNGKEWV